MVDPATAAIAIKTISSAVGLVDKVYDTWAKFRATGEVDNSPPREHYEKIETSASGDALVHTTNGQVAKEITREELAEVLTRQELTVLEAIEKKMEMLVSKWSQITAKFETLTPAQQGVSKIELDDICADLSKCLGQVMQLLENIGFILQDHYGDVKMIAASR